MTLADRAFQVMVRAMSTSLRFLIAALLLLTAGMAPAGADEPTVMCDGKPATMIGTPGDDKLIGDASDDVIVGLGGNDTLVGAGGNDTICGFDGDDTLIGGPGDDILLGGRGSDWLDYRTAYQRQSRSTSAPAPPTGTEATPCFDRERLRQRPPQRHLWQRRCQHLVSMAAETTSCGVAAAMTSSRPADEFAELRGGQATTT